MQHAHLVDHHWHGSHMVQPVTAKHCTAAHLTIRTHVLLYSKHTALSSIHTWLTLLGLCRNQSRKHRSVRKLASPKR
jgi:hypothetical protein